MTGFIKKLFQSKDSVQVDMVEPAVQPAAPQPVVSKPVVPQPAPISPVTARSNGAFFLDVDEAKSFGNIEYMRSSKAVRRTFSKKKIGEDNESIRLISAMEMLSGTTPSGGALSDALNQTNGSASKSVERRKADSSMDMFRSMAREIKKG